MKFKDVTFKFLLMVLNIALFFVVLGATAKVIWMLVTLGWDLLP